MIRLKTLVLFACFFMIPVHADWAANPPNPPNTYGTISTTSIADITVYLSFNANSGDVIASWKAPSNNGYPTYSFYNGSTWSAAATISTTSLVGNDVLTASNPNTGQILATWNDANSQLPTYSFYTSGTWGTTNTITTMSLADYDVYCTANSTSGNFFAAWADSTSFFPTFSFYNGSSWSVASTITTSSSVTDGNVFLCSDTASAQVLATWIDTSTGTPFYSIYNGSSWSTAASINASFPGRVAVYSCPGPSSGQFFAAWIDNGVNAGYPTFSFYNGSSWSTPTTIPASSPSSMGNSSPFLSYDSSTGQLLATWPDANTDLPYYSFYANSVWSTPAPIGMNTFPGMGFNIFNCFNSSTNQFFAAWIDGNNNNYPTYSIYSYSSPPTPAPSGFSGVQKINDFIVVQERYNTLTWQSYAGATNYYLYLGDALIATLEGNVTSYEHHDQPKSNQVYSLVAITSQGASTPATTIVGGK